jgi:hypothetical protein
VINRILNPDAAGDGLANLAWSNGDDDFGHGRSFQDLGWPPSQGRDFVDGAQSVQGARVADERQELGEDVDQPGSVVPWRAPRPSSKLEERAVALSGGEAIMGPPSTSGFTAQS